MKRAPFLLVLGVAACGAAPARLTSQQPAAPRSAEALIAAMHDRYADTWYRAVRFRQRVIRTMPDGKPAPEQVWLEHLELPGKLRIDMAGADSSGRTASGRQRSDAESPPRRAADYTGNATLFAGDSTYVMREGVVARRVKGGNILLVLGFDVYGQPVAQTLERLRAEGFDLGTLRTDTWQGRPAYVVGAAAGDSTRAQFWIDAERLLFVRLIQPTPQGRSEARFDDYQPLAGGWLSKLVIFLGDGREVMREVYFDIEANPALPAGLLDPARWHEVRPR